MKEIAFHTKEWLAMRLDNNIQLTAAPTKHAVTYLCDGQIMLIYNKRTKKVWLEDELFEAITIVLHESAFPADYIAEFMLVSLREILQVQVKMVMPADFTAAQKGIDEAKKWFINDVENNPLEKYNLGYNEKQGCFHFIGIPDTQINNEGWTTICNSISISQAIEFTEFITDKYGNKNTKHPTAKVVQDEFVNYLMTSPK